MSSRKIAAIFWLPIGLAATSVCAQQPTAQALIDSHDATVSAMRSGDIVINVQGLHRATGDFNDSLTFRWQWDGERERIGILHHQNSVSPDIKRLRRDDILIRGDECRFLYNFDPEGNVSVDPGDQNGVSGTLASAGTHAFSDPGGYCLLKFGFSNSDVFGSLGDLTRRMKEVRLIGSNRVFGSDEEAWQIQFVLREKISAADPESIDVWIDPDRGFRAVQLMKNYGNVAGKNGRENMTSYTTAETFTEFGEGVFLPATLLERLVIGNGEPVVTGRTTVSVNTINFPIDDSVFQMPFPEGLYVADERSSANGDMKWFVWGDDDHPELEILDPAEYQREYLDRRPARPSDGSTWTVLILTVNAAATIILAWFIVSRRRQKAGK